MHSINLREIPVGSNRPNPPVENLGGPSHIDEDEVDFRGHFTLPIGGQHDPMPNGHIQFHPRMIAVHKKFRAKIDNLSIAQMCHVFHESYPGIQVLMGSEGPICKRCKQERGSHRFSQWNHMDPGEQPHVLRVLTQVEEMLIARVNPILQVTHARGGKYKYSGHTISFPQDISMIARNLPRRVEDLDFLIVRRCGAQSKYYECYVKRSRVMNALYYKIQMDKFYQDVQIDMDSVTALPENPTDVSTRLKFVDCDIEETDNNVADIQGFPADRLHSHPSSFVARLPNERREVEEIRTFIENVESSPIQPVDWPDIGSSPINEYNTEGLLDMAFPTLFPTGEADWLHPRICNIQLHEYGLHLLRYFDQRFGSHPRFRYFLLNMIMRHRSQATAAVFVKKNIHDNSPTTIEALRQQLLDLPDNKLAEHLMHFGSSLRGTRAYWTKCRTELTDMITQLGCPTLFFTLSAADTKWPDLHNVMPRNENSHGSNQHRIKIENVIRYPHIVAMFMHHRFNIFREEVIQKYLGAKDFWYRFVLSYLC
jgi:ATP-dependent DNA helicase PIF1